MRLAWLVWVFCVGVDVCTYRPTRAAGGGLSSPSCVPSNQHPTVYTLANRLFLEEGEVKKAEAQLEAERRANEAAVAMYKARRVRFVYVYVCVRAYNGMLISLNNVGMNRRRSAGGRSGRRRRSTASGPSRCLGLFIAIVHSCDESLTHVCTSMLMHACMDGWMQVRMAQERERRELERKRDYRLQIQQRNLGVRAWLLYMDGGREGPMLDGHWSRTDLFFFGSIDRSATRSPSGSTSPVRMILSCLSPPPNIKISS